MLRYKRLSPEGLTHALSSQMKGEVSAVSYRDSREDYEILEAECSLEGKKQSLIIHIYDTQRSLESGRIESSALDALANQGFPSPVKLLFVEDASLAGAPFLVMTRPNGERLGDVLSRTPQAISDWLDDLGNVLSRLHHLPRFDWAAAPRLLDFAERRVKYWRQIAGAYPQSPFSAQASEGFEWLHDNYHLLRASSTLSTVHHHFSPENLFVDEISITAIMGWCRLNISDPALDVAQMRMFISTRWGSKHGESFLAAYKRRAAVPAASLLYWEVYAAAKQLVQFAQEPQSGGGAEFSQAVYDFMKVRLIEEA
ncbi:hypothetical protein ANRL4_01619 [Anaerolineae bacterium]|nr:hypothetical protein ANRL4_01619 [Anaerolineae bacterium]